MVKARTLVAAGVAGWCCLAAWASACSSSSTAPPDFDAGGFDATGTDTGNADALIGSDGPDEACAQTVTNPECVGCCAKLFIFGQRTLDAATITCACQQGVCLTECQQSLCATPSVQPALGTPCQLCVKTATRTTGACVASVRQSCEHSFSCVEYEDCLTGSGCTSKPNAVPDASTDAPGDGAGDTAQDSAGDVTADVVDGADE